MIKQGIVHFETFHSREVIVGKEVKILVAEFDKSVVITDQPLCTSSYRRIRRKVTQTGILLSLDRQDDIIRMTYDMSVLGGTACNDYYE